MPHQLNIQIEPGGIIGMNTSCITLILTFSIIEKANKESINRVDIYGLFKAIDFPIDYYKKVEKSNLPRLIGACQDYLRNIIDGIPVKKIPRNLYVKRTQNLL